MTVAALPTPLDSLPLTLAAGEAGGGVFWLAVVLLVLTAACLGAAAMTVLRNRGAATGSPPTSTLSPTSPPAPPAPPSPIPRPDPEVAAQIAELRSLVLHARQTVERLEGMLEEAGQARVIASAPVHREPLPDPVVETAHADLPSADGTGADDDANDLFGLSPSPTRAEHVEPKPSPLPNNSGGEAPDLSHIIYQLADDGLSPVQIAQQLSQHTGKVELILALRNI